MKGGAKLGRLAIDRAEDDVVKAGKRVRAVIEENIDRFSCRRELGK